MPRDPEHVVYKEKWACFACRKCFKQRNRLESVRRKGFSRGETRVVLCPQCRRPMTDMGWDFKVPKRTDAEQWKKVALLAENGVTFRWRYEHPHNGPGVRPARLRDVEAFLKNRNEK